MFAIDENTLDYLRLTGRDDAQVRWSRPMRKTAGLWADDLRMRSNERTLQFDLSSVVRNMAGPSNPHRRLPVDDLPRGIADEAKLDAGKAEKPRPDAGWRGHHRRHHPCTNTSNPRNVIAAALLARNANAWACCASRG